MARWPHTLCGFSNLPNTYCMQEDLKEKSVLLIKMAAVGQPQPPQTTQLEFHQAMQDFKTMFPEMDEDVIEAVLRANQGAVDATIDQLLTMSTDNENERLRTEMDAADNAEPPPGYSPTTPPPSYQQAVPGATSSPPHSLVLSTPVVDVSLTVPVVNTSSGMLSPNLKGAEGPSPTSPSKSSKAPLRTVHNWNPPLLGPLPSDFLRISLPSNKSDNSREMTAILCSEMIQQKLEENERQRRLGGCDDPELVRYLEDERIALFLQNEEFMQELRRNKDFMSTLERDTQARQSGPTGVSDSDSDATTEDELDKPPDEMMGPFPFTKALPNDDSDAAFREKLKNMGKLSRRKFAQLARLFTRRKKRSAKQILSEGAVPSKDNLLLEDDEEESGDEFPDQPRELRNTIPCAESYENGCNKFQSSVLRGLSPERSPGPTA